MGRRGVLVLAAAFGGWALKRRARQAPAGPITITPFTTDGGGKSSPRLSPDGEKVAYSWTGPDGDNQDIYVKAVGPGTKPLRITEDPALDFKPYLVARRPADRIHALEGGQRRRHLYDPGIGRARTQTRRHRRDRGDPLHRADAVLGAGRRVATPSARRRPKTRPRASSGSPSPRSRSGRSPLHRRESLGDLEPQVSPDGRLLAFVRSGSRVWGNQDVWVQPVSGGAARRLTSGQYRVCLGPQLDTGRNRDRLLERLDKRRTGGWPGCRSRAVRPSRCSGGRERGVLRPSVGAADGVRPVARRTVADTLEAARAPGRRGPRRRLSGSSPPVANASYSPDSQEDRLRVEPRAAPRTSGSAMPTAPIPSSSPPRRAGSGTPRWSPDGRRLVFDSLEAGNWDLYVVGVDGGTPAAADPRALGGRNRDLVARRPVDLLPLGSHRPLRDLEGPARRGDGGPGHPGWRLLRGGVGGRSGSLLLPVFVHGNLACPRGGRSRVGSREGAGGMAGLGSGSAGALLRDDAQAAPTGRSSRSGTWISGPPAVRRASMGRKANSFIIPPTVSPDEKWILFGEAPGRQSELMLMENFR